MATCRYWYTRPVGSPHCPYEGLKHLTDDPAATVDRGPHCPYEGLKQYMHTGGRTGQVSSLPLRGIETRRIYMTTVNGPDVLIAPTRDLKLEVFQRRIQPCQRHDVDSMRSSARERSGSCERRGSPIAEVADDLGV